MHSDNSYDIAIIGGGISACVFASTHIKNGFDGKIAIIENGRKLGGRSSTRNSLKNIGWELNHGSPNFNICNKSNNHLLHAFIQELLDSKIIESDTSDVIELKENHLCETRINSDFFSCSNYIPRSSMSELSHKIISKENLNDQVDYFFETLIVRLNYENNRWILTSKNGNKFKTKFLICSSNLILHKRSLNILKVNQIPLRKAIPVNNDNKIDEILNLLIKQNYVRRLTFLIYTKKNYFYKDNYKNKFRYFILSKLLEEKFKFERIIFQKQLNNNLGIVIHTKNNDFIEEFFYFQNKEKFKEKILINFNELFDKSNYINKLIDYRDLSIMYWRASQPSGLAIPEDLQVCKNYNIAFCGDWFNCEGFGRIEGAILSALKLSCKINAIS